MSTAETRFKPNDGLGFGPVPVRYRRDGWTPDRQLEFIEALADGGCVEQAARAVGMSRNSAYALRRRPDAAAFRLAWDAAIDNAVARLADAAMFLAYRILRMLGAAWTAFDAAFEGKEPPPPEPEDSMLGWPYGPGKTWR